MVNKLITPCVGYINGITYDYDDDEEDEVIASMESEGNYLPT
jgi:hypothetical protein